MSMLKEFQDFAMKSNFIDMATGIIIGGAAGTVVKSLVSDIIMPPIGYLMGGVNFSEMSLPLGKGLDGKKEVFIKYGSFIDNIISFLIIMGAIFLLIKMINKAKARFEEEEAAKPAEPPRQEVLHEEIRDALQK